MKKMITLLCAAVLVFSCGLLATNYAQAAENQCYHRYDDTYVVTSLDGVYSHQYSFKGTMKTCHVYKYYTITYPRCRDCGDVNYGVKETTFLYNEHSACGLGRTSY